MSEPVVETQELAVRFGGVLAVDHVNFVLRERELRCLIGPNGAGKSTFFNCLTGVLRPTAGRILLDGEDVAGLPPNKISRRGIARDLTIVIVEHDMEVVMGLARTITVLHYGKVLAEGTPAEIQANPRVQEVYLKT